MHLPTVVFLAPAFLCVLSWLGAGLALPRRLLTGEKLLDWLTRIGAGSVAVSLLIFALGRAGAFDVSTLDALTVALGLIGAVGLLALVRDLRRVEVKGGLVAALLATVAGALLLDLVASTAPPTSADALKYHLALPKLWLQLGSIGDPFWRWEGFNPSAIETLFAQGLALGGGSTAAALHAAFAVLCALAIFGLGRELGGDPLAGAVAAFLFVLQGIVTWEATSAFIELGLTFYVVLAAWHAVRWVRGPSRTAASWTGFFCGAAAGTKYLGLVAAAVVLACFGFAALVRRRPADIAYAACTAVVVGGAWYVKNALVTGNPFYPLYFGGKWLTPFADATIRQFGSLYGVGGGIARLPLLPVDLLRHGGAFDRGQYVGTGIFLLASLAVVTRRTRPVLISVGGAIAFVVAWWATSPQARFLLPALAVLAAAAGGGAAGWLRAGRVRRQAVLVVLAIGAAAWLAASVALTRQLLPVTLGAEARVAFLQRLTGTYRAFTETRARLGPGTVGLAGYPFAYNMPGRAVTADVPEFVPSLSRGIYVERLRSFDVRAVLVGGGLAASPQLAPIRGCLSRVAVYHARYVTSRSLARSVPYDLVLYSLVRCA